MQNAEGYSVLWLFSQEFRKAGVLGFFSDRKGLAEETLEQAFEQHNRDEVIMVGASLRLFLAPGLHFYTYLEKMMERKGRKPVTVRAMYCHPEKNYELPGRSFVEEFNQDGSFPKDSSYKWGEEKKFLSKNLSWLFFKNME
jgi:hypothetical protein